MNRPQTPDYGEPWQYTSFRNCIRDRHHVLRVIEDDLRNRSRSCVNACAGMADPAAEFEAMLDAIKEVHTTLESIAKAKPSEWGEMSDQFKPWAQNRARHALAKLQPFIKP